MKVLDLFSGIGGFSLGLERADMQTTMFCEMGDFQQRVINKHWPDVPIHNDVSTLHISPGEYDVICGGFPCQDISISGKMKGLKGERSGLWSEFKRLIKEGEPEYAIIENVANLRSNGLVVVLQDLWKVGYDAQWHIIPAQAVGAEHERERIWIIAYPHSTQCKGRSLSRRIQEEIANSGDIRWGKDKPGVERTLNGVSNQSHRLLALGNAVVPQIPEAIGRAIYSTTTPERVW